jgi:DNA-binding CsgD family transcriptional regulator
MQYTQGAEGSWITGSFTTGEGSPQSCAAARWRSIERGRFDLALAAASEVVFPRDLIELARQLAGYYADDLEGLRGLPGQSGNCLRDSLKHGRTPRELLEMHSALEAVLLTEAVAIDADGIGRLQARIAGQEALRSGERQIELVAVFEPHLDEPGPMRSAPTLTLSQRERDVLSLLAQSLHVAEIGTRLFLSPETVRTYAQRATTKLGATTRIEAVVKAVRMGEIS